jgi:NADH/NAD ratio-sensing transcriptional regulator Rex
MTITKRNREPILITRNAKVSYEFKIEDNTYQVIESFDSNNEICGREIRTLDWRGFSSTHYTVSGSALKRKLIKAAKQHRIFNS